MSERRFLRAHNCTMVKPGPEAQQLATYISWLMQGTLGGILAGALFVLPSLAILIALTWTYLAFGDVPVAAGVLFGIEPAVTAIVVFAAYRIGSRALRNGLLWGMAGAAFVPIFALGVPFPYIVLTAGVTGYLGGRVMRPIDLRWAAPKAPPARRPSGRNRLSTFPYTVATERPFDPRLLQ